MVDPHEGYLSFRKEVEQGTLSLDPCKIHPDIKLYTDTQNEKYRFTYTIIEGNIPKGILQIISLEWDRNIFYFQLGIAVGKEFRRQGVAKELSKKGLEEFLARFPIPKNRKLGIEAIVEKSNVASQKLAAKTFPNPPTQIKDEFSGEEAFRYEFIVAG